VVPSPKRLHLSGHSLALCLLLLQQLRLSEKLQWSLVFPDTESDLNSDYLVTLAKEFLGGNEAKKESPIDVHFVVSHPLDMSAEEVEEPHGAENTRLRFGAAMPSACNDSDYQHSIQLDIWEPILSWDTQMHCRVGLHLISGFGFACIQQLHLGTHRSASDLRSDVLMSWWLDHLLELIGLKQLKLSGTPAYKFVLKFIERDNAREESYKLLPRLEHLQLEDLTPHRFVETHSYGDAPAPCQILGEWLKARSMHQIPLTSVHMRPSYQRELSEIKSSSLRSLVATATRVFWSGLDLHDYFKGRPASPPPPPRIQFKWKNPLEGITVRMPVNPHMEGTSVNE
jgi:hypothetical protein